ncbi:MAG: hypothetical protein IJ874_02145 [Ruminococcus sp.]|nr:hypothetical protein [Ruminococcus sp.]
MRIIRTILLTIITAAVAVYLAACVVGNTWNPKVTVDTLVAASTSNSEKLIKEAQGTGVEFLSQGLSELDGYVYFKDAEVSMDQALMSLGFTPLESNRWTTPAGNMAEIRSDTFCLGGRIVYYRVIG